MIQNDSFRHAAAVVPDSIRLIGVVEGYGDLRGVTVRRCRVKGSGTTCLDRVLYEFADRDASIRSPQGIRTNQVNDILLADANA